MSDDTFVVPIANSAGYAIDQIGMVMAYAEEARKFDSNFHFKLCADERFQPLVAASGKTLNVTLDFPYSRNDFPQGSSITAGPRHMALQKKAANEHILETDDLAEDLQALRQSQYELTISPAGFLLANPITWVKADTVKTSSAEFVLERAAKIARNASAAFYASVKFLFFFGGKSLTDSESTSDGKRIGGMVKSVGAEDQIKEIEKLQKEALAKNILIVPVFAQYGDKEELQVRIKQFNKSRDLITPVTNFTRYHPFLDWNGFDRPAHLIAAAQKNFGAVVVGNGSTMQHLAAASVPQDDQMPIIILRPPWSEIRGEDRWDGAAKHGRVDIIKATHPQNISYEEIMSRVETAPHDAARLIREASQNVCQIAYEGLVDRFMTSPQRGSAPKGDPSAPQL